MAKNYDLFLERMKQKYNMPQTTAKTTNALQYNTQTQNQYYNPAQAEQPLEEEKQGLNWWDKFGAGYQQARDTFATSFLDLGEGLIDSLAMPIAAIADWAGNERVEKNVNRFIEKEWLSALPQSDFWQDAHNVLGFDFLWSDEAKQVARNKEALPEIGEQLASGIGSAVGFAALNAIPYVGPVVAGMASGGSAAEQALQEGSSSGKALGYGILKGGLESALEFGVGKGLGKLGAGTGKIAGLGKGASTTMGKAVGKSAATKIATKLGQNFVEEGLEEVLSEVADPFLKKLTYKQDEDLKELIGESHDPEHLLETFFVSGLTGAIFEGGQITTSIATSGGIKSWDIRQEADTLKEINNKMEEAILKGDELELKKLEKQKEITIKKVEKKFDNYVEYLNSQKDTTSDKRYSKLATSTLQYAEQQVKTKEVLTKEVAQKLFTNKKGESLVDIKSAPVENGTQSKSYYDSKTNTVYLNEQSLSSLNNALETIVHETGHAIHTGGLNTNFVNQMTQDFNDFDSLVDEQYKGKIKSFDDLISHYENVKGFKQNLLSDEKLIKDKMNEKKISKEQAYQELRNDYMIEEIANDIFSKKYFSNLDELRMVVAANKPSFVQRLKDAYRKRFTNSKNKPSNYKEVMKIFKDGIDQNYQNFKEELKNPTGKRREGIRYKTGENLSETKETRNDKLKKVTEIKKIDENQKQILKDTVLRPVYISSDDVVSLENSNDFFNQKFVATALDWLNFEKENNSSPRLINLSSGEVISISSLFTKENMKFTEIIDYLLTITEIPQTRTDILNLVWNKSKKEKFNNIQNYFSEKLGYFNGILQEVIWNRFDISSLNVSNFTSLENLLYQYAGSKGVELSINDIFMSNSPNNKDRFEYISEKTKTDLNNLLKNAGYDLQITDVLEDGKKIEIKQDVWERTLNYYKFEDFLQQYLNGNEQKTSNDVLNYVKTEFEKVKKRSKFKDRSNYDNLEYVLDNYVYTPEYNNFPFAMLTKKGNDIYLDFYTDDKLDGYFWSTKIGEETEDEYKSKTRQIEINEIYLRFKEWDINESARRVIEEFYSSKPKNFYEEIRRYHSAKGFILSQILNNENSTMDNNSGVLILKKEYYTPFMKKIFIDNLAFGLSDTTFSFGQLGYYGCFTPEENVLELNIRYGFGDVFEDTLEHERFHSFYHKNNYIDDGNLRDLLLARNDYIDEIVTSMIINNEYLDLMEQTKVAYSKTRAWFNGEPNGEINWLKYIKEEVLAHVLGGSVTIKDDNLQIEARERLLEAFKKYIQINLDKLNISLKDSDEYVYSKGIYRLNGKISKPKRIVYLDINADYEKLGNDTIQGVSDYLTELETSDYETYDFEDYEEFDLEDYLNEDEFDENGVLISKYSNRNYKRYNLSKEIKSASEIQRRIDVLNSKADELDQNKITPNRYQFYERSISDEINKNMSKAWEYFQSKYEQGLTQEEINEAKEYAKLKEGWLPDVSKELDFSKFENAKVIERQQANVEEQPTIEKEEPKVKEPEKPKTLEIDEKQQEINKLKKFDLVEELGIKFVDDSLGLTKETFKKIDVDALSSSVDKYLQTSLNIYKKLNEAFNGSSSGKADSNYSMLALKSILESKSYSNEFKQKAFEIYKKRYENIKYYKELLDNINHIADKIGSKFKTKLKNEIKEQRMQNGLLITEDSFKTITPPSELEILTKSNEEVEKAFNSKVKKQKDKFKKQIEELVEKYGLIDSEQQAQKETLLKLATDTNFTQEEFNDQVSKITLKIKNFETSIQDNKARNQNAESIKTKHNKTIKNIKDNYGSLVGENYLNKKLTEIEKLIDTVNYKNYQDVDLKIEEGLDDLRKELETIKEDANEFIIKEGLFTIEISKEEGKQSKTFSLILNKEAILKKFKAGEEYNSLSLNELVKRLEKDTSKLSEEIEEYKESLKLLQPKINTLTQEQVSEILGKEVDLDMFKKVLRNSLSEQSEIETIEGKLSKLEEFYDKKKAEKIKIIKEEAPKKFAKIKEEVNKTKSSYEKELKELLDQYNDISSEKSKSLKESLQNKINSLDENNYKNTEELDETFSKLENEFIKEQEKTQKNLEEEISERKEKLKKLPKQKRVKETVKFIRTTIYKYTESAKSIKEKANATQLKVYTKTSCEELLDLVTEMLNSVGKKNKKDTKVEFTEEGKRTAIDKMFEAFNTLANDQNKLATRIKEIVSEGLKIKMPDYEIKDGKIYKKGRDVYTSINDFTVQETNLGKKIIEELDYLIKNTIDTKGSPTILAKNIMERTKQYEETIKQQQETIDQLIKEQNKSKVSKENVKNTSNEEDFKNIYKEIEKANKRIDKLSKELEKVSTNKDKLRNDINTIKQQNVELKTELKEKGKKLDKKTKEAIDAQTNLEGVYNFNKNDGNFINRVMKKLGIKTKLDINTYEKIADKFNKGDIDSVVDEIMNFIQNQKAEREYLQFNEETGKVETLKEMADFKEVYAPNVIEKIKEQIKNDIMDRILKGTTKVSALPKVYRELVSLKTKLKADKLEKAQIDKIKDKLKSIKKLSNNNKKSIFQNNIDNRFKAVAEQFELFSDIRILKGDFREALKEFKKFLTEERFEGQTFEQLTGLEFPQDLFDQLDVLENVQGQVSIKELELYNKILGALKTFIENGTGQRLIDIDGEKKTLQEHVEDAISEQNVLINKLGKENFSKILQTVDPRVVFKIASGFNENSKFYKLFEELQRGDTQAMVKEMELKTDLEMFFKQHRGYKKSLKKKVSITGIEASVGEFISLYKLIRRPDAYKHITKYGIEIGETRIKYQGTDEEVKLQIAKLKSAIEEKLDLKKDGSLNKQFFDKTVQFFKAAAEAKEYVDIRLYGYSNVLKKDENGNDIEYFPIRISSIDFNKTLGNKQFSTKMSASLDYSWNKSITGSGGMVKVENVNDVISQHARQVAQYYGYAIPLDKFNQIYSFKVADRSGEPINLRETMNSRFGKSKLTNQYAMEDYLRVLFDDIRGNGSNGGELDKTFNKIFGSIRRKYSTYVLGANLKVAGVQLAAIPAVYKYASLKSMLKASKKFSKEMTKEYELPALGKYRTYDKSILKSETLNDNVGKVADAFGKLMSITDNLTIQYAWKVALYETNFDKAKAEKLFEKIVRETQPQYSAIERSALMRSKNELVKMLTQFKAQANKNFSALVEMWYKARYYKKLGKKMTAEDKKIMVKTPISIAAQSSVAIFMSYLFKHIVNDLDEDEFSVLGFIENFFNELVGIIPLINNFKIDLQKEGKYLGGYLNVYEMNLGGISKLQEAFTNLFEIFDDEKNTAEKVYDSVNAIGIALGIPTENIYKLVMGLHKRFIPEKAIYWDEVHKGLVITNKTKVNEAIEKEQYELAETYYKEYTKTILELDDHTTKIMFNLYKDGYENCYLKQIPKTLIVDNEEVKVGREQFLKTYSKLVPKLKLLVRSTSFRRLTKEEQEKVISKLINLYYSLAKKDCIEDYDYTELETMILYYNNFNVNNLVYLAHINELKSSENETKKEKVQRYINSLRLPAGEKYLLYYLSGYKLSERNQLILKSFLSSKGLPKSYIKVLFN